MVKFNRTFKVFITCILLLVITLTGCQKGVDDTGNPPPTEYPLRLTFENHAGAVPLVLNTPYTNPFGEPFTITKFKYYISNISLINLAGSETKLPDTYFLVDQ